MSDREFSTGAVRTTDADETRFDLISPIGLERLARIYAEGAEKYGPSAWEQGLPIHDLLNHGIRHLFLYLAGDRSEDHLAKMAWGCFAAMHSETLSPELNREHLRAPGCRLSFWQRWAIRRDKKAYAARRAASQADSMEVEPA